MQRETIAAIYFDGTSNRKHQVELILGPALELRENGASIATWPYDTLRRVDDPGGDCLRLHARGAADLARLELRDPQTAARLERLCPKLDHGTDSRAVWRIVGWSLAAAASIVLIVVYGIPALADRLAPLVPIALEKRLGDMAENQVHVVFRGRTCRAPEGQAALQTLVARLSQAAGLDVPVEAQVIESSLPNAFALPGGRVYILDNLLQKAEDPDEVGGVLAHEIGHVVHRDGLRRLIQTGGTSYLIGLLFGDITGAGAAIFVTRELLNASYSRDAEAAADAFAIETLTKLGRPIQPLGQLLVRLTPKRQLGLMDLLATHPLTADRLANMTDAATPAAGPPLLSFGAWRALKAICRNS